MHASPAMVQLSQYYSEMQKDMKICRSSGMLIARDYPLERYTTVTAGLMLYPIAFMDGCEAICKELDKVIQGLQAEYEKEEMVAPDATNRAAHRALSRVAGFLRVFSHGYQSNVSGNGA